MTDGDAGNAGDNGDTGGEPQPVTIEQVKEQIPEDLKGEAMLDQVTDVGVLWKNYVHAQRALGGSIKIPGENATDEQRADYLTKLGRPASPGDYGLKRPESLDNSIPLDEGFVERLGVTAHQLGLSQDQARTLFSWHMTELENASIEAGKSFEAGKEALKKDWGGAWERNTVMAQRAIAHLGGKEMVEFFDQNPVLANNPGLVKMFSKMGMLFAEQGTVSGEIEGVPGIEDAQKEANDIINNTDNPDHKDYHDKFSPNHDTAVAKVKRLFELVHGTAPVKI